MAKVDEVDAGPADSSEICGWYMYDWANSPYYQVYVTALMPIILKWLAEAHSGMYEVNSKSLLPLINITDRNAVAALTLPSGIAAGSYPAMINWVTILLQTVCLLTFSAFGDYGTRRKQLLMVFTFSGAFFLALNIFCLHGSLYWLAGLIRIFAGIFFVMCGVYYNAYLPLLAAAHEDNEGLVGEELAAASVEKSDDMSNKGFLCGYAGGILMLIISFLILRFLECSRTTPGSCKSQFDIFFWPNFCMLLVGVWWAGFAIYSFCKLKSRPGPEFPKGNMLCLGWKGTCDTLFHVARYRNTWMYLLAFMLWSDATNTLTNVAVLLLEDNGDASLSGVLFAAILAVLAAGLGTFVMLKVQQCYSFSGKSLVLFILCVYTVASIAGLCGLMTALGGFGFYLVMLPIMLLLGSLQAYSRSIFASLTPVGMESAMFSFFEITDKGSNLIGAGMTFLIYSVTRSYVGVFGYIAVAFFVAGLLLFFVDVDQGVLEAQLGEDEEDSAEDESYPVE